MYLIYLLYCVLYWLYLKFRLEFLMLMLRLSFLMLKSEHLQHTVSKTSFDKLFQIITYQSV